MLPRPEAKTGHDLQVSTHEFSGPKGNPALSRNIFIRAAATRVLTRARWSFTSMPHRHPPARLQRDPEGSQEGHETRNPPWATNPRFSSEGETRVHCHSNAPSPPFTHPLPRQRRCVGLKAGPLRLLSHPWNEMLSEGPQGHPGPGGQQSSIPKTPWNKCLSSRWRVSSMSGGNCLRAACPLGGCPSCVRFYRRGWRWSGLCEFNGGHLFSEPGGASAPS